ncbi:MAG: prephenate dehydratase [Magnetovibrionaceae bacterium]
MTETAKIITFQGHPGAYSDIACRAAYPDMTSLPSHTFEDAFRTVREGKAELAMIPIENTVAGRVADIHHLMPNSGLHIIGEHYQRVNHHLLGLEGARLDQLTHVHSHVHALSQCRNLIRELGLQAVVHVDTAGAAAMIAEKGDPTQAAIASELAAKIDGLTSLKANIEDAETNTTRFLVLSREPIQPPLDGPKCVTTFIFHVKHVPAALYKALGGFATNKINMTKLESYLVGGHFVAAQFYADVEAHPDEEGMKYAFDELRFFTKDVTILGTYPAHPYRFMVPSEYL